MSPSQPDTKQRILTIAGELFARQGYTGTTIADIARELGTTTAALYYHFPSKAAILGGLLAGPLAAYTRLLGSLDSGQATPEDLLGAIIDLCVESRELASILDRDPAALAMIDEQLPRSSAEITAQTVAALAGPAPDHAALIRANAALAVAKAATLAAMRLGGGKLEAADRAEVLAIAMRALKDLSRTYGCVCQGKPLRPISRGRSIRARPAPATAGFWRDTTELRASWRESRRWEPAWSAARRAASYAGWKKAVDRTLDWVDVG